MEQRLFAGFTYEEVVRRYNRTVAGVCVMRLRNLADAEDCFQNTFVKLYTKSPEFKDENHLKAWIIRVAINECNNYARYRHRVVSLNEVKKAAIDFYEDGADLSWALIKLEPKYREVLYLHYCEQYKIDEVAVILKKNPNTIKTLLRRGREKLKKIYGGDVS